MSTHNLSTGNRTKKCTKKTQDKPAFFHSLPITMYHLTADGKLLTKNDPPFFYKLHELTWLAVCDLVSAGGANMPCFLYGPAYREALAQIANDKGFEGLLSRLFWRRFSIPLGRWLAKKYPRINPDTLTVSAIFLGLVAAVLWGSAAVNPWYLLAGAVLLQVSSFGDGLDGDVARALKPGSRRPTAKSWGMFLDTMGDRIVDTALIVALGLYLGAVGFDRASTVILVGVTLASTLISTFSRHAVREAYAPFALKRPYASSAIHAAGRGLRLLILTLGAFGEFGHVLAYAASGRVIIGTLALLSGLQVFQVFFRAFELRQNLHAVSKEEH